jgi:hypothetical protein
VSPRKHFILFSTRDPPAIQRIPWPTHDHPKDEEERKGKNFVWYNTWILNDLELPWLVETDGESMHASLY